MVPYFDPVPIEVAAGFGLACGFNLANFFEFTKGKAIGLGTLIMGDVTGDDDQVGPRREAIERVDRRRKRSGGIDATVGEGAGRRNVQIGDLSD